MSVNIKCLMNSIKVVFLCLICGHYVFWSVPLFVCVFLVKVSGRGSFWCSWSPINLKLSTYIPYDMIFSNFNAKLETLPLFPGPLNIENDTADGAYVYYGHILVKSSIIDKAVWSHYSKFEYDVVGKNVLLIEYLFGRNIYDKQINIHTT